MPRLSSRAGFTLMELLIASTLSVVVLMGVIQISASMLRYHFEEMRKGRASGMNLLALQRMHKEIENATQLGVPANPISAGGVIVLPAVDTVGGCINYLIYQTPALPVQVAPGEPSWAFWYCRSASNHASYPNSLVRYQHPTCPIAFPGPTCGDVLAGGTREVLIYDNFFRPDGGSAIFSRMNGSQLRARYIVGRATPTVEIPIPVAYKIDTTIHMNIPYAGNNW